MYTLMCVCGHVIGGAGWQPSGAVVSSDGDQSSTTPSRDGLHAFSEPHAASSHPQPSAAAVSGASVERGVVEDGLTMDPCRHELPDAKDHRSKSLRKGLVYVTDSALPCRQHRASLTRALVQRGCVHVGGRCCPVVVDFGAITRMASCGRELRCQLSHGIWGLCCRVRCTVVVIAETAHTVVTEMSCPRRSTPLAGGSVGVPLMTLVRGHAPTDARDFSTALQVRTQPAMLSLVGPMRDGGGRGGCSNRPWG